jgi:hypothetical protein
MKLVEHGAAVESRLGGDSLICVAAVHFFVPLSRE